MFSTMLPGRWRARWDLEGDTVVFEVRPALPASVWLPTDVPAVATTTEARSAAYVAYGVDEDGAEMRWYPARVPHMMLTGSTGTGKTSTAHALLGKVTQYGWPVWVLDAKRVEFLGFRTWPNVQVVAGTITAQVALIHRAWTVMETRYAQIEAGTHTVADFEPLIIFLDEFAEFRSNLVEWYAQVKVRGDPSKPPTLAEVASLARKARTARIHLVLSTQRPDAEFLTGEMRDNFGARVSMGRLSPQGAMMMWENPTVGVSLPRAVTGRAMAALRGRARGGDPVLPLPRPRRARGQRGARPPGRAAPGHLRPPPPADRPRRGRGRGRPRHRRVDRADLPRGRRRRVALRRRPRRHRPAGHRRR